MPIEFVQEPTGGTREKVNVVVNMPEGLGRYKVADASQPADDNVFRTFEWYLKNHLGSTMLVYGTVASTGEVAVIAIKNDRVVLKDDISKFELKK
ncbi:hypothetical protein [Fibrobacter sp. UBA4297]|uniref:hypothetical protein n=1 Tax=Fibrobacter sp. UBA4297 TaxID=1946536 RepID=UPI0025C15388|nr:hypothetical protein [Fibrobacter sp. UBA4297]